MLTCQCGSTFLKKNKTQHINTLKHKTWLKDEEYAQRLDREMAQLILDANTIEPTMEPPKTEIDLENKDPLIVENPPIRLPEKVNINIHCNRCNELKLALQVIGISMGITSFALVLWLIAKK